MAYYSEMSQDHLPSDYSKERLGIKAKGSKVLGQDGTHELREPPAPYKGHFGTEKGLLRPENTYYWNASP